MFAVSANDILKLLDELESRIADDMESQRLDFKEWKSQSKADAVDQVIEMAVCMANGGGGTVVFGVSDRTIGRSHAIKGVPHDVDTNLLMKAVYDRTDPKITPVFEALTVPEGTGRLIIMHILPGMPPYTDTSGKAKIRIGKDCQPLTGSLRRRVMVETGTTDFTADDVPGPYSEHVSPAAMERLRDLAKHERVPQDLVALSDRDLLSALGVIREERLTYAGLLLTGREQSIRDHIPAYLWTYFRMRSDTEYDDRVDTAEPLPMALGRITDRIMASNPITTIKQGMFHLEYRTYPDIAIREALMNAFCHRDFRIPGPIMVKQYPGRLEIANPGTFIGGISPDNILHHSPVSRSPLLVDALARLRLINRGNLGIPRMFASMLMEGKESPIIQEQGNAVKVTFLAGEISGPFRAFVSEQSRIGRELTVDHLLILQYLIRHSEIDTSAAARICQRQESEVREILSQMEKQYSHIERGGSGRGTYWTMRSDLRRDLAANSVPERDARIDWETAKTRILSVLRQRAEHKEPGLTNREIRQIVRLDRNQVYRLVRQLMEEEPRIAMVGDRRYARYEYR